MIPGAVALVKLDGEWLPPYATGAAVTTAEQVIPASPDTVYDLASLTKVVATLPAVLMLVQDGVLDLQSPLLSAFPEWKDDASKAAVLPQHLLTHTSGLPAWRDFHSHGWDRERIVREVLATPLEAEPGERMVYSDLGYILLGELVERACGLRLDALVIERLYGPLEMTDTLYLPPPELRPRLAACEYRESLGRVQWGDVNDDNAHAMGGVSGHAGLFSTAADVATYVDACWPHNGEVVSDLISPAAARAAVRSYPSHMPNANRGLGWSLKDDPWDCSGAFTSPSAFGHTGYTGTSIVVDPELGLSAILLTNRVHITSDTGIVTLRRRFHNVLASALRG